MKPFLLLFILLLFSQLAGAQKLSKITTRKENYIDLTEKLTLDALILRKYGIEPKWQTIIQEQEFEGAYLLPGGDYLLQTIVMKALSDKKATLHEQYAFFPHYGPVYRIDHKTGNILWSLQRNGEMSKTNYQLLALKENQLLIQRSGAKNSEEILCIDLQNGAVLWQKSYGDIVSINHNTETGRLLLLTKGKSGYSLKAINTANSTEFYSRDLMGMTLNDKPSLLEPDNSTGLITAGNKALLISSESGEIIRNLEFPEPPVETSIAGKSIIFCFSGKNLQFYNFRGDKIHDVNTSGLPGLPVLKDNRYFWIEKDSTFMIVSMDTLWSKPWTLPVDSSLKSNLYRFGDTLCFTTPLWFYFVDAGNGSLLNRIPTGMTNRLPDDIRKQGNLFILNSEYQIACFNPENVDPVWKYNLRYQVNTYRGQGMPDARIDLSAYKLFQPAVNPSYSDYFIIRAKENLLRAESDYRMDKSYTNSFNLSLARQSYANLMEVNRAFESMSRSMNLFFATQEATAAILSAKAQEFELAAETRKYMESVLLIGENMHREQLPFYIKRYLTKKGYIVFLVDTRDGKWAELPVSPNEGFELESTALLGTSVQTWNKDNNTLMLTGLGLDPEKWEETDLYRATTIRRSVLCFDLNNLQFREPDTFPAESLIKR